MRYKYKIFVKLGTRDLIFKVNSYEIIDNSFYKFFDEKTQTFRIFDTRICEIVEEVNS